MLRSVAILIVLAAAVSAQAADNSPETPTAGDAVLVIRGTQHCSMCEFGVGEECCLGIQAGDSRFIVEGPACDKLFDNRHSGEKTHIQGVAFLKNGALYMTGKTLDAAKDAVVESDAPAVAVGTLHKSNGKLVLRSDKLEVEIIGPTVESAGKLVGKKVQAAGKFEVKDQKFAQLTASSVTPFQPRSK